MQSVAVLYVIPLLLGLGDAARILALVPFPSRSHWIVMEPLFQELATRGHQLTVVSAFPQKKPLANYTDIDFSHKLKTFTSAFSIEYVREIMPGPLGTSEFINRMHELPCSIVDDTEFKNVFKGGQNYDLIFTELFGSDCFTYFAYKLKVPLISFTTSIMLPWAAERVGLPDNPSYIPNYLVSYSADMDLWQRTYNTFILLYTKFFHQWIYSRRTQALAERYFKESLPPIHEVVANTSLLFVNSYHALSQSRPFPPNVVEVGGIHMKKQQPLPEDLKVILDKAKNGAIIMSFGSILRAASLPKSTIQMIMKVFAAIPQTVIFKYEEDFPDTPVNVITRKWLPQRDLIEHENVIAVIQHGGLASTIEAAFFGKPMIGIPLFADQQTNIQALVRKEVCIPLELDELTEDKFSRAVHEITNNPKYRETMKQVSLQFRDRPMTALDTAVFWTEYVIRHKGAPNLRPSSVSLPLYQYLLLDVVAVILLFLSVLIYTVYFIIKLVLSVFQKNSISSQKKSDSLKKKHN